MRRNRLTAFVLICLIGCLSFGCLASAEVIIPFDMRPQIQRLNVNTGASELVPMGTYAAGGSCSLSNLGGGVVRISGDTSCYRVCDKVTCNVYLYRYNPSKGNWPTVASKKATGYNTSYLSTYKDIAVATGHYYYVSAGHTAKKGSTVESMSSSTGSLYIG